MPGVGAEVWRKARLPCSAAGALHPGAPHPHAPLLRHVRRLPLLPSAVQSLSSLGSRPPGAGGDRQRDERFGRSKARVPCLSAEVLRESPLDPRRGAYAGWGAKLGEQAKAFRLSTRSP